MRNVPFLIIVSSQDFNNRRKRRMLFSANSDSIATLIRWEQLYESYTLDYTLETIRRTRYLSQSADIEAIERDRIVPYSWSRSNEKTRRGEGEERVINREFLPSLVTFPFLRDIASHDWHAREDGEKEEIEGREKREREKKALKRPQPLRNEESNAIIRIPRAFAANGFRFFSTFHRDEEKLRSRFGLPSTRHQSLSLRDIYRRDTRYLDRAQRWNVTLFVLYFLLHFLLFFFF